MVGWLLFIAQFVGAPVCADCHPAQAALQAKSGHAKALARVENKWAFGAGDQAITYVSRIDEEHYLEHRLSWYSSSQSFAATPGHQGLPASEPGVRYRVFDAGGALLRCFLCHSTGPLSVGAANEVMPTEAGVRCEGCHGPGGQHVAAARRGSVEARRAIVRPVDTNNFCGACHRMPPSAGSETDFSNPWNVRHQPVYLSQSLCATKGGASCVTCHDPHGALVRDVMAYNSKCQGCHADASVKPVCRKNAARGCASCHMPKVKPLPELAFTNHWIRVWR